MFQRFFLLIVSLKAVSSTHLYNLSSDATESFNLYMTDEFQDTVKFLEKQIDTWSEKIVDPAIPHYDVSKSAWTKCGGICPWVDNEKSFSPLEVEQLYSSSSAPNIVMVLVDDWGWNDVGFRSTYLNWTTPTIDRIAMEGVKLENYFTNSLCVPSRGALMTGRYPLRLGLWDSDSDDAELPLMETTLAQELKSAGYMSYMVGKWHLGMSTSGHLPTNRGFDSFYGFLGDYVDYDTKMYEGFLDLQANDTLVTDSSEISSSLHNALLLESKAESFISTHADNHPGVPFFLYYATQLVHSPWTAPSKYLAKCADPALGDDNLDSVQFNYCAMNVMLDEVIANLTCTLDANGFSDNTLLIIMSANGGEQTIAGNSYPFKGHKGSFYRGGVSATAIIHGNLVPLAARGETYYGQVHVTDWLPTLMGIATNNKWNGSLTGNDIDGVDMWSALSVLTQSSHREIVHYVDHVQQYAIQYDMMKLNTGDDPTGVSTPDFIFAADQNPGSSTQKCTTPSLVFGSVISEIVLFIIPNTIAIGVGIFSAITLLIASMVICWIAMAKRKVRLEGLRTQKEGSIWTIDYGSSAATGLVNKADRTSYLPFSEYSSSSWSSEDDYSQNSSVAGFEESDCDDFFPLRFPDRFP